MPKKTTKTVAKKTATKKAAKKTTRKTTAKKAARKTTRKTATKKAATKRTTKKKDSAVAETELLNFIQPAPAPTAEEISHAAYLNYLKRQQEGLEGCETSDWLAAEESLKKNR